MPGIAAWEDDPHSSSAAEPVGRPVPSLDHAGLSLVIVGRQPDARLYPPGTHGFRYWTAADSLARSVRYWGRGVPAGTRWHNRRALSVDLDAGDDLNAYYDRQELCFFHARVAGTTVYSGESPDVVCHELGHALLDAVRPQLWNAASIEVASFHESFGDISAILSALDLPSVREDVLRSTGGRVSRASRVSRLAEQLGWAIRQSHPDAVDPDCLRNAANSFFYRQPEGLPPMAPASALSSEPHSFSRVGHRRGPAARVGGGRRAHHLELLRAGRVGTARGRRARDARGVPGRHPARVCRSRHSRDVVRDRSRHARRRARDAPPAAEQAAARCRGSHRRARVRRPLPPASR